MVAVCHAERTDHRHRDCGRGSGQAVRGDAELLRGYADRNGGIRRSRDRRAWHEAVYRHLRQQRQVCADRQLCRHLFRDGHQERGILVHGVRVGVDLRRQLHRNGEVLHPHRYHRQRLYGQGGQRLHHTHGHQQRNGKVLPAEHRHVERHRHQERRDGHRQRSLQLLHRLYAGAVLCQGLRCLLELQCAVDGADPPEKVHRSERTGQCRHHHESLPRSRHWRRKLTLRQLSPVEWHGRVQHHQQCRKLQEGAERLLPKQLRYRRLYPRVLLPYYRRCRQQETVLLHCG